MKNQKNNIRIALELIYSDIQNLKTYIRLTIHPILFCTFLRIAYLRGSLQPRKVKEHVFSYLPPLKIKEAPEEVLELMRFVRSFRKEEASNGFKCEKTFDERSCKE